MPYNPSTNSHANTISNTYAYTHTHTDAYTYAYAHTDTHSESEKGFHGGYCTAYSLCWQDRRLYNDIHSRLAQSHQNRFCNSRNPLRFY